MPIVFECRIDGEHEPRKDAIMLGMQPEGIPTLPGNSPHIDIRDLPEVLAAEIGRRGDRVRVTIERIA